MRVPKLNRQKCSSCAHLPPTVKHLCSVQETSDSSSNCRHGKYPIYFRCLLMLQTNHRKAFFPCHEQSHLREAAHVLHLLLSCSNHVSLLINFAVYHESSSSFLLHPLVVAYKHIYVMRLLGQLHILTNTT